MLASICAGLGPRMWASWWELSPSVTWACLVTTVFRAHTNHWDKKELIDPSVSMVFGMLGDCVCLISSAPYEYGKLREHHDWFDKVKDDLLWKLDHHGASHIFSWRPSLSYGLSALSYTSCACTVILLTEALSFFVSQNISGPHIFLSYARPPWLAAG